MKAELVPENGDPPIPIVRDVTVVGRRDYCDVVIDHPSLSKRHCVLVKTDGLLVIRDLATTNGTKVKGQKVRWAALLPDDRISLGGYKLRVYLGPDDMPSPSEQARARGKPLGVVGLSRPVGGGIPGWAAAGAPGFPEPSHSLVTAMPQPESARLRDDHRAGSEVPAVDEFQFEILDDDDDDDEIIDLE